MEKRQKQTSFLPRNYRLRDYRILKVLDKGIFAITYLAVIETLPMFFVVKEFFSSTLSMRGPELKVMAKTHGQIQNFQDDLSRFLSDAKLLVEIQHDNIIQIHEYFEDNGTAYIVMPYRWGESLAFLLDKQSKINEKTLLQVVFSVLDGLDQLHGNGYVHRGLRMSNIHIPKNQSQMLAGTGATCQILQPEKTSAYISSSNDCPFEKFMGTEKPLGPWTDIYSMGSILYRCVTGKGPVRITERSKAIVKQQDDPLEPAVRAGSSDYSKRLLSAIDEAMSIRIKNRPQSTDEFRNMLQMSDEGSSGLTSGMEGDISSGLNQKATVTERSGNKSKSGFFGGLKKKISGMIGLFGRKKAEMKVVTDGVSKLSEDVGKINTLEDVEKVKKELEEKVSEFHDKCKEFHDQLLKNEKFMVATLKEMASDTIHEEKKDQRTINDGQGTGNKESRKRKNIDEKPDVYFQKKISSNIKQPSPAADDGGVVKSEDEEIDKDNNNGSAESSPVTIPLPAKLVCLDKTLSSEIGDINLEIDQVTIGNGPENSVHIQTNKLSRSNARIFPVDGVWHIEEFVGSYGVKLNERPIQRSALKEGDNLYIGYVPFRYTAIVSDGEERQNELVDKLSGMHQASQADGTGFFSVKIIIKNIDRVSRDISEKEGRKVSDVIEARIKKDAIRTSDTLYRSSAGNFYMLCKDKDVDVVVKQLDRLMKKMKLKIDSGKVGVKPFFVEGSYGMIDSSKYKDAREMINDLGIMSETIGLPLV